MNYTCIKNRLREIAIEIQANTALISESTLSDLSTWQGDLNQDALIVAVVGEFNRGKSTLLNALFGTPLLPTGVTPTTAVVTMLAFSERECIEVQYRDGHCEDLDYSPTALRRFVAKDLRTCSDIEWVRIGLPHPLLRGGVLFIDTPGVSDLSMERTEVTYGFVPRADIVLFVIDSSQPVTRSEVDFLQTAILDAGSNRIVFVSNFADLLEDEERTDAPSKTRNKLSTVMGSSEPDVFLVSAIQAVNGSRNGSGINELTSDLNKLISVGPRSVEKATRMRDRLVAIARSTKQELHKKKRNIEQTAEDLAREQAIIEGEWKNRQSKITQIGRWVNDREEEIFAMTEKSLESFFRNLYEDTCDFIKAYTGPDFKSFIEVQLPIQIKKRCKVWVDGHADGLRWLIMRLSSELTQSLNREFDTSLPLLEPRFVVSGIAPEAFQAGSPEPNRGRFQAGLILGGAAGLLALAGLTMAAPLIGLAAFPLLSNHLEKSQLEAAKAKLIPELDRAFYGAAWSMRQNVLDFLHAEIAQLRESAELKFTQLLAGARSSVATASAAKEDGISKSNNSVKEIESRILRLCELEADLETLIPKMLPGECV